MRAVICREYGLDHARLEQADEPTVLPGTVRIAVKTIGVSFANLLVIDGKHQNRKEPPFTPGTEVAGVVLECGEGVKIFKPGDRVVAGITAGGYAEQVVAPETTTFLLPNEVSYVDAVQLPTI